MHYVIHIGTHMLLDAALSVWCVDIESAAHPVQQASGKGEAKY